MSSLFDTGIRPAIDKYLLDEAAKVRDYGEYWSASSAGYCMRRNVFERLKVPHSAPEDARKQRVFTAGHVFHDWVQEITKASGQSIASEVELQDEDLMVRGHFDDLVLKYGKLILYEYKTQNSRAFTYQKGKPMSYYHKMQLGTYMYMLRKRPEKGWYINRQTALANGLITPDIKAGLGLELTEARILKISKDDLRMDENQLLWSDELESEIKTYWTTLNKYWEGEKIPPCSCADHEGGFLSKEQYNPFWFEGSPCSIDWYEKCKKEGLLK